MLRGVTHHRMLLLHLRIGPDHTCPSHPFVHLPLLDRLSSLARWRCCCLPGSARRSRSWRKGTGRTSIRFGGSSGTSNLVMNDSCGHSPGRVPRDNMSMSMSCGFFALPCAHARCASPVGSGTVHLDKGGGHLGQLGRVLRRWEAWGRWCEARA